tara:strand:- start:410 stop:1201 length:792 start_codon:yes stop_codon:yes gene_type:complete
MRVDSNSIWKDSYGREYFEIPDPSETQRLYESTKEFWVKRGLRSDEKLPQEAIDQVLSQQAPHYATPPCAPLAHLLKSVAQDARGSGGSISVVELGCANGILARHFDKFFPDLDLTFFGMEALSALVDDACKKYPNHSFMTGTAENFLDLGSDKLGGLRFDVFLASGVLCMLPPELAREVLRKATEIAEVIICRDYLQNKSGELSRDKAVYFELSEEHPHIIFANPYEIFIREIGHAHIEYNFLKLADPYVRGTGAFLAKRNF